MLVASTITLGEASSILWDAIVIGAGPAGSVTALLLARQGRRVLLVDQATFPRNKVCGGCLNGNASAVLKYVGLEHLTDQLDAQPTRTMILANRTGQARIALPSMVSVSRMVLDEALILQAIQAGVQFLCQVRGRLSDAEAMSRKVVLKARSDSSITQARIVVLAHGLKSGTIAPHSRIGVGVLLGQAPFDFPLNTLVMAIGPGGYVGGVHVEQGRYDLAAALDSCYVQACGSAGEAASRILKEAGMPGIPGLETAGWRGTPLLTRRVHRLAGHRWFAVGDAAGYVEPFTGEGMAWAMTGALNLAPIANEAIASWDSRHAQQWQRVHHRCVGRKQTLCRALALILRSQTFSSCLVQAVSICPALASPFVRTLSQHQARFRGITL